MTRRAVLASWALFVVLAIPLTPAFAADSGAAPTKWNFVFVLIDDLGWADVGCNGNTFHGTPNIDLLARQGMRFTDAYAACPVCSPTRASILSGKYPATLNLTDFIPGHWRPWAKLVVPTFNQQLPLAEVTIAEALKSAGYVSGSFGKWHLGGTDHYPDKQGFDEFVVTGGRHFYPTFRTTPKIKIEKGKYLGDFLTDQAEQFVRTNKDRPFFLYLSHYTVHIPLEAKKGLIDKYERKSRQPKFRPKAIIKVRQPGASAEEMEAIFVRLEKQLRGIEKLASMQSKATAESGQLVCQFAEGWSPAEMRQRVEGQLKLVRLPRTAEAEVEVSPVNHPVYAAMVEHADESVGRMMKLLDELKLADRTVFMFFSDNGGLRQRFDKTGPLVSSNAPLRNEKGSLYEGGIRVPMIVRWPGSVKPGSTCSTPVSSVDFWPTLADIAGRGGQSKAKVDGESLVPLLKQGGELKRDAIYWHYPHYHHTAPCGAIRQGDYKLIEYYEDGKVELYNLRNDLGETTNLAANMPDKAQALRQQLQQWRQRVGAKMPTVNPDHDAAKADEWQRRPRKNQK